MRPRDARAFPVAFDTFHLLGRVSELMSFQPPRFPTARSARASTPVLSVGRRVVVSCSRDESRVALTDALGTADAGSLPDGAEVEILAWRPRGPGGARYQVQSTRDKLEGWVSADHLRAPGALARAAAVPAPAAVVVDDPPRRFGRRS